MSKEEELFFLWLIIAVAVAFVVAFIFFTWIEDRKAKEELIWTCLRCGKDTRRLKVDGFKCERGPCPMAVGRRDTFNRQVDAAR